jgi:LysM repeat protein
MKVKAMKKNLLFLLLLCCCSKISATGDSLRYLRASDTVFLAEAADGHTYFEHRMEKGQTLYSLARFYGLKLDWLYELNPGLAEQGGFYRGQAVRVSIPDSAIVKTRLAGWQQKKYAPVYYVVRHGDSFYHIAKELFQIPVDTLKGRNRLSDTRLRSGQLIHIGWLSLQGIPESLQADLRNSSDPAVSLRARFEEQKALGEERFHNGAAYWQREKTGANDFFALHRHAPAGSVIEIHNPLKKKTVYAKVIGKIPDRAYKGDIIAVLSPSLARMLGAKDARFFVEVRYFE